MLEYAKVKLDIVLIHEPSTFIDPNEATRLFTISHQIFHQVISKHKTNHHVRVITYIINTAPHLSYQFRMDIKDNPDIQCIQISSRSVTHIHLIILHNRNLGGAEDTTGPGEQALLNI